MKRTIAFLILTVFMVASLFAVTTNYSSAIEDYAALFASAIQPGDRVAVVSFSSDSADLNTILPSDLEEALINEGATVLERRSMEKILKEFEFQASGFVSDEEASSIGHMLGATKIIVGKGEHLVSSYRVDLKMIDLETLLVKRGEVKNIAYTKDFSVIVKNTSGKVGSQTLSAGVWADLGWKWLMYGDNLIPSHFQKDVDAGVQGGDAMDLSVGVSVKGRIAKSFLIQTEAAFTLRNEGNVGDYGEMYGNSAMMSYSSLEVPVLFLYNPVQAPVSMDVFAGGFISLPLGAEKYLENTINGYAYGAILGIDAEIPAGKGQMLYDFRFKYDLVPMFATSPTGEKVDLFRRAGMELRVGYSINLF